jgi:hypothetical protein
MTVNQHQATIVWKQKLRWTLKSAAVESSLWYDIHWFWEKKDSQNKACKTDLNLMHEDGE